MAVHNCGRTDDLSGLAHHSDRAVQYLAVRYADRLADNAIVASVGSKGGSYDNALAEAFNIMATVPPNGTTVPPDSSTRWIWPTPANAGLPRGREVNHRDAAARWGSRGRPAG